MEILYNRQLSLTFTVFKQVHNLKARNLIKKRLQHSCFPVKFAKFLRAPPILKNIYERLLLIFFNFNSYSWQDLSPSVQDVLQNVLFYNLSPYQNKKNKRVTVIKLRNKTEQNVISYSQLGKSKISLGKKS